FSNNRRFLFDTDGNQIDAYGSKINFFAGKYYLYGNSFSQTGNPIGIASFSSPYGIKSYSSNDLVNWKYEGYLYDPAVSNPCNNIGGCGRPHILYNSAKKQYIFWANAGSSGYIIATSSSPSGPFTFAPTTAQLDPRYAALQPADFAVETVNNVGYIVFSALNFAYPNAGSIWPPIQQTLHISKLTSDLDNTTLTSYNVTSSAFDLIDQETESPDIFVRNGIFYVVASNTCGFCNGSIALVYRSKSIQGPWTRQIIAGDGCNSQVEGVLPLGSEYVWHGTSVPGGPRVGFSGHIFQPLKFNADGSVQDLNCASTASFSVSVPSGNSPTPSGAATHAADASPPLAAYTAVCDSDQWNLFQTWQSSKAGTLKSVAVNIAASVQTIPLTLTVFKYSNIAALEAPNYKWTELGSATYTPSNLTHVFQTATVNLSATVSVGDRLGIEVSGADYVPYCHLEYDLGSSSYGSSASNTVLLQQGGGQNSWRGLDGKTSIVYPRAGKGIKFYAT
ncbi:glycoside hydrolase family 43 protein, partial [Myriangium duriaei CBS 260.36]